MDKTDLVMALNTQDEYLPTRQRIAELVSMLHQTGQDTMIAEAIAEGETVESLASKLGEIWDVDETVLAEAINLALADL